MATKETHTGCTHLTCSNDADISKIIKVSILISFFMLLELWGHYKTNSLSLLADSLHLLVDVMGFMVSLIALYWAKKSSNNSMTFGYHRVEIIGSLFSVALIWVAVGYLMIESVHKYIHPKEIDGGMFFAIAVIGFFVNLLAIYLLHYDEYNHKLKHKNLNIRAAYVHIIGDLIQSVGVIIAGCVTYFYPSRAIFDILCTVSFSILVLCSSLSVIKDAIHILAEGTPKDIKIEDVKNDILDIENIYKILEIYSWSLSTNRKAIMMKILAEDLLINDYENLLLRINKILEEKYMFEVINIQVDTPSTYYGNSGFVVDGSVVNIKNTLDSKTPF
ncbi:Zinc transporter 8 [Nosema granulosis]|uniref:Zinc transporter 8 n=1 Tax=Nosema granulosis TaxID=83296 RepID=A0A9P6GY81_9MICR|nr:Zinc transporter 8 [Nosema granulosis]